MKFRAASCFWASLFWIGLPACGLTSDIVLQPSNSGSDNAFVYQFLPTYNFSTGPFGDLLSAGNTADGFNNGHNTNTLLQFDLSSSAIGLSSGEQVASATLRLYAVSSATEGFGADPTAVNPIALNVNTFSGTWSAATVTYGTLPPVTSDVYLSAIQNGVNRWVNFDVTAEVQNWLDGTIANDGLLVTQGTPTDINGQPAIGVFYSTLGAQQNSTPTLAPELVISLASSGGASTWSAISGNWSNPGNWQGGVPNAPGAGAAFNLPIGASAAVTLDSPETVGSLQLANSAGAATGYALSGSNLLTLNNSGSAATIAVANGSQAIGAPVALADGLQVNVSGGTLAFTGGGISGVGPLTLGGGGILILSGSDTYGGGTNVNAGTLVAASNSAIPDGSNLTIEAGGTLRFDASQAISAAVAGSPDARSASPVPEPDGLALLLAGLLVGSGIRRGIERRIRGRAP